MTTEASPENEQSELLARFNALQRKLQPLWKQIGHSDPGGSYIEDPNTVVVLPSMTVDVELDVASQQVYEERMLFMLFLLRQPNKRLIYLTSLPVSPSVIDYYLHILPSVTISNARRRLSLISPQDASARPLVNKLLDRPDLIEKIRRLIPDLERAHLVPFLTTDYERDFAVQLGVPMYAADPRFFAFGTKSGCRQVFAEEGVQHPMGEENLSSESELIEAIARMRRKKPAISQMIVKHNEGVSGYGNAHLDLDRLPAPGDPSEPAALTARLKSMQLEMKDIDYAWYIEHFEKHGGIVEEFISGEILTSPSAQLRVTPMGQVELLSTHDQMLGGPGGQTYLGARFPANPEYGPLIMHEAKKIGDRFAREGIIGRFALDFLAVRTAQGQWDVYAIEVNLRKGGTTHPFLTLQYLTDGQYDPQSGIFRTVSGTPKYYVASDTLKSPAYCKFTPEDVFDLVSNYRLHYDHASQTGVVLHMVSGIGTHGRLGLTAIGNSPEQAEAIYQRFIRTMDAAAASKP
jgi:hypothetical protein